jgi:hypothetical protein
MPTLPSEPGQYADAAESAIGRVFDPNTLPIDREFHMRAAQVWATMAAASALKLIAESIQSRP